MPGKKFWLRIRDALNEAKNKAEHLGFKVLSISIVHGKMKVRRGKSKWTVYITLLPPWQGGGWDWSWIPE
ncbi:MAG: hypothetical protein DRO09_00445 [Thermoprotei archaeon]|nr:MAG: hypothetical protein DRO09_00445 [Thermoprotei archaeon]